MRRQTDATDARTGDTKKIGQRVVVWLMRRISAKFRNRPKLVGDPALSLWTEGEQERRTATANDGLRKTLSVVFVRIDVAAKVLIVGGMQQPFASCWRKAAGHRSEEVG